MSAIVSVPKRARRGEVIEIKAMVSHVMETGFRRTQTGKPIPADLIRRFSCTWNGEEVFSADLQPAIAANPFLSFFAVARESGTLHFEWAGDHGFRASASARVEVE